MRGNCRTTRSANLLKWRANPERKRNATFSRSSERITLSTSESRENPANHALNASYSKEEKFSDYVSAEAALSLHCECCLRLVSQIQKATNGQGVDVIIDFIGPDYFEMNLASECLQRCGIYAS